MNDVLEQLAATLGELTLDELFTIVERNARKLGAPADEGGAREIARRARGTTFRCDQAAQDLASAKASGSKYTYCATDT